MGARVKVNVATRQKKKEYKNMGKKEAGEEKKQATDFKETECCTSAVV